MHGEWIEDIGLGSNYNLEPSISSSLMQNHGGASFSTSFNFLCMKPAIHIFAGF